MIIKIADNIISPLGETTEENFSAVLEGKSALKKHSYEGMPDPFMASLFENREISFDQLVIRSISAAIENTSVDITSKDTVIILSSTKGNVQEIGKNICAGEDWWLANSAKNIANHFSNPNTPIVVSNACISGLASQILATRLLESGEYKTAIVCGADIQSKFIVSGFQCLKALSPKECRPYDEDRCGLNLGEAVATIIWKREEDCKTESWLAISGAVKNDAFHISGPSRKAEGCFRAITECLKDFDKEKLAFVNAHGTATLYNDEMEAQALNRAGLQDIPTNSLKGYYGHTMGAAGILETIISMKAVENGVIIPTRGYSAPGTGWSINVSDNIIKTEKQSFLKLLSGFGGANAAMLFSKGNVL